tara:strand:+ start:64 stop:582 length:519 start_codon:yes stop_codon:yes gene_type:complete
MIIKTKFKNLVIIQNKKHKDKRGYFQELFTEKQLNKRFIFTVMSYSKKNVLRGLHIQKKKPQGKIITVLKGKVFDVTVDLRKKSKTFGKVYTCILSEKNSKSLYVPPGFAHGFLTLSKENIVIYSNTSLRHKSSETTIKYNDETLKIKWPQKQMVISNKDKIGISYLEYIKK